MDTWDKVGIAGLAIVFGIVIGVVWLKADTDQRCKESGWLHGSITINFKRWCHAIVEQTDIVIRLEDAERLGGVK